MNRDFNASFVALTSPSLSCPGSFPLHCSSGMPAGWCCWGPHTYTQQDNTGNTPTHMGMGISSYNTGSQSHQICPGNFPTGLVLSGPSYLHTPLQHRTYTTKPCALQTYTNLSVSAQALPLLTSGHGYGLIDWLGAVAAPTAAG
jgi:hypothetical protein